MYPVGARTADGVVLGAYSRFVAPGDGLALFDRMDGFLGTATVAAVTPLGGLRNAVRLDGETVAPDRVAFLRDLALDGSRFVVRDNLVSDGNGHGILVQEPDGLVEGNRFERLRANAIRLLTSTGVFKEGVGAFDVIVRGNRIADTGSDTAIAMPSAAIAAYAVVAPATLSSGLANAFLLIAGNSVERAQDGCVTVSNSFAVRVDANRCASVNLRRPGRDAIAILRDADVSVTGE